MPREDEGPGTEKPHLTRRVLDGSIVGRLVKRVLKPAGSAPGTLVHTGRKRVEKVHLSFIDFDEEKLHERTIQRIDECFPPAERPTVTWVNVDGLHDPEVLATLGRRFGFHPLVLEDVLSTGQRPKVEDHGEYFFVIVHMLTFDRDAGTIETEQVSFIVGDRYVFSFQERPGDVFDPVRERVRQSKGRIRSRGADYLVYALVDAIVDRYFQILESIGDLVEDLEDLVLEDPSTRVMHDIQTLKRESLILRRAAWPLREALGTLYRGEVALISEDTRVYISDVYDHVVQVIDTVETLREVITGAMDLYLSGVSNRMNEVMKVLTVIATIFIPLSFVAGVYGMNFDYMPELSVRWAYPALLVFMFAVAMGMLVYFKRKGWI